MAKTNGSRLLAWLAALAILVQCLLPVSHAFAMSAAAQDDLIAQSICSYHDVQLTADEEPGTQSQQSGKLPLCPMCQTVGMGGGLALPQLSPVIVRQDVPPQTTSAEHSSSSALDATFVFDPARPRGPPASL